MLLAWAADTAGAAAADGVCVPAATMGHGTCTRQQAHTGQRQLCLHPSSSSTEHFVPMPNTGVKHEVGPRAQLPANGSDPDSPPDPTKVPGYCGSCYGAQSRQGQCCNTCAQVSVLLLRSLLSDMFCV